MDYIFAKTACAPHQFQQCTGLEKSNPINDIYMTIIIKSLLKHFYFSIFCLAPRRAHTWPHKVNQKSPLPTLKMHRNFGNVLSIQKGLFLVKIFRALEDLAARGGNFEVSNKKV